MVDTMTNKTSVPVILSVGAVDKHLIIGSEQNNSAYFEPGVQQILVNSCTISTHANGTYQAEPVDDELFAEQLVAVESIKIDTIEIGLLVSIFQVNLLVEFLQARQVVTLYCPFFLPDSQIGFDNTAIVDLLRLRLLGLCDLVIINVATRGLLVRLDAVSNEPVKDVAHSLLGLGAKAVLFNGVKSSRSQRRSEYFFDSTTAFELQSPVTEVLQNSPTGDGFAFALAALVAKGHLLVDAIVKGLTTRNREMRVGSKTRLGSDQQGDIPLLLARDSIGQDVSRFPSCGEQALGLYPVVDRASWLERLLPLGVSTIQLRVKDLQGDALHNEIARAVEIAQRYDCRLFINDYWELAIECGAYGVHLGQEDIDSANLSAIHVAGLRLGLSSHCHYEVARCLAIGPSYIAIGPVFPTTTKIMPWTIHGIEGLSYWQGTLEYPLVAIAGIKPGNIADVVATGVSGVAMITAITESPQPESICKTFLETMN